MLDLNQPETYSTALRLFKRRFASRARACGMDEEDLRQELLVRVLSRQSMPCAYDPSRGAVSTYLFRSFESICSHLQDQARIRRTERLEVVEEARIAIPEDRLDPILALEAQHDDHADSIFGVLGASYEPVISPVLAPAPTVKGLVKKRQEPIEQGETLFDLFGAVEQD